MYCCSSDWRKGIKFSYTVAVQDRVDLPIKTYEIRHGSYGEIDHQVHVMGVYGINCTPPIIDSAPVRIKDGEVKRRVTYGMIERRKTGGEVNNTLSACHNMFRKGVPEMKMTRIPMP